MKREGRPAAISETALVESQRGDVNSDRSVGADDARAFCDGLLRRRRASHRLVPLGDGLRDPWLRAVVRRRSTYGLSHDELLDHARSLRDAGWQPWEIELRLDLPAAVRSRPTTANQRVVDELFAELMRRGGCS